MEQHWQMTSFMLSTTPEALSLAGLAFLYFFLKKKKKNLISKSIMLIPYEDEIFQ